MEQKDLPGLPKGWVWTKLGILFDFSNGKGLTKKQMNMGTYKVYGGNGITGHHNKWLCPDESLVIGRVGAHCGNVHLASKKSWITDNAIYTSWKTKEIYLKYFYYLLSNYRLNELAGGSGQPYVSQGFLYPLFVPLPPLPEQHRIVSKTEELFTKLDAGVESLKKVKSQLKSYRQAVLKYAFEGKLTEEWREKHKDELEPASILLKRIKEEQKRISKGKFMKLPLLDTTILYELPKGWEWTKIADITESMRNGIYKPKKFYNNDGIACLRMYNIENGSIIWKDIKRMNLTMEEIQEYKLIPGDILVNRVNSRELVGKSAPIPLGLETCVYESKNIRLRLIRKYLNSIFVGFWFQIYSQQYFNLNAQQTVGMASINQEQLGSMPIPIIPLIEQNKIVEEIEQRFSIADEMEKTINENLNKSEKLKLSSLKKAFEGKLVPQDPTDEPACVLLERIKKDKEKQEKRLKDSHKAIKLKNKKIEIREQEKLEVFI